VYSGQPAGGPTAGIFFTRWVTHFCAPAFAFLAGTSAYMYGLRHGRAELSRYLWTRGALLVLLELTVVHVSWTFTLDFTSELAGVIWMLGWCMILLAGLVRFSTRTIATIGLLVIFLQQAAGLLGGALPQSLRWIGQVLYFGGPIAAGGFALFVLYNLVPWVGVMAAGYAFGSVLVREPDERDRFCLRVGIGATVLFLVAAIPLAIVSGDNDRGPLLFRVLEQNKYRNSQLFLLMTLGPAIAVLPSAERARGWFASVLETFGRVPMFYYLLHIPLIHATALLVWLLRDGTAHAGWFTAAPFVSIEEGQRWGLGLLYLVWAIDLVILYLACRWYAGLKTRQPRSWMRFI
jgi:uncharacterized membrane protein